MCIRDRYQKAANAAVLDSDSEFEMVGFNADIARSSSDEDSSDESDSDGEAHNADAVEFDPKEFAAYTGNSTENEKEWSEDEIEFQAFLSITDFVDDCIDWEQPPTASQVQMVAYMMDKARAKVKYDKGRGKGRRYPVKPSGMTVEDRRKKLADLKARTVCKECGKRGHWAGDRACSMKGKSKSAHFAE